MPQRDTRRVDAYTTGRERLIELTSVMPEAGRNEAATRLEVIDRLLTDVLGWAPEDLSPEEFHAGDYVDYAIGRPIVRVILEAKREGVHFELPAGLAGKQSCAVASVRESSSAQAALEQVIGYCQKRGVPIAVLCNGHQLIAFLASRQDGVPPLDGRAFVLSTPEEMVENFGLLWKYLSKEGVALSNLQRALAGRQARRLPPDKLSTRIVDYPGFRNRSRMETDLKILGGLFLQDLQSDERVSEEFLRKSYCTTGALSQYAMVSKEILRTRYAALQSQASLEPVRTKSGVAPSLAVDLIAAGLTRRPVILLGDVGVGKSMFIRHLIRIDAADVLENAIVLYVDFGREPALVTNLYDYVTARLLDQLRDDYGVDVYDNKIVSAVYNGELNRFAKSPAGRLKDSDPTEYARRELDLLDTLMADTPEHVRRCLAHLSGTAQRSTVIVLDNVDQRPLDFQESVFLMAQSFAETWPAAVFLTLRPSTFHESRVRGSLSAYQPRVFTVSPARTDQVIVRRLQFAREQLTQHGAAEVLPTGLTLDAPRLVTYIDVLLKAFEEDNELRELVDNISGGNLRLALTLLETFVGSGYVSTARILEVADAGGMYVVPLHEFMRAIIFGEFDHYDPTASAIPNLFDITTDSGAEHFLLPELLARAQKLGESVGAEGFVCLEELYDHGQSLGYTAEIVGVHLKRAFEKRLLDSRSDGGGPCRVTTVGSYMYKKMASRFVYIDAMIVDTPITSQSHRAAIRDVRPIIERLDRSDRFREYLDTVWADLETSERDFDWSTASAALSADTERARERAVRAAERQKD